MDRAGLVPRLDRSEASRPWGSRSGRATRGSFPRRRVESKETMMRQRELQRMVRECEARIRSAIVERWQPKIDAAQREQKLLAEEVTRRVRSALTAGLKPLGAKLELGRYAQNLLEWRVTGEVVHYDAPVVFAPKSAIGRAAVRAARKSHAATAGKRKELTLLESDVRSLLYDIELRGKTPEIVQRFEALRKRAELGGDE